jgi:hypothetical protein
MATEPLTPEILQICTAAVDTPTGLNAVGITDTFRSETIPCAVTPMSILFRFRLPALKHVVGKLRFALVSPDGREVWQNSGQIDLFTEPTSEDFTSAVSNMIFNFQQFVFQQRGLHELRVCWNDAEVAVTPLHILGPLPPDSKPGRSEIISSGPSVPSR